MSPSKLATPNRPTNHLVPSVMAILIPLKTEVLCLSCHRRVLTTWKSHMVCIHIIGVWKFLRIGAGVDSVKAAFCTICPVCLKRRAITADDPIDEDIGEDGVDESQDDLNKIQHLATSKPLLDTMSDIKKGNDIVIIETLEIIEKYLLKVRPLIEVGKIVQTTVTV